MIWHINADNSFLFGDSLLLLGWQTLPSRTWKLQFALYEYFLIIDLLQARALGLRLRLLVSLIATFDPLRCHHLRLIIVWQALNVVLVIRWFSFLVISSGEHRLFSWSILKDRLVRLNWLFYFFKFVNHSIYWQLLNSVRTLLCWVFWFGLAFFIVW